LQHAVGGFPSRVKREKASQTSKEALNGGRQTKLHRSKDGEKLLARKKCKQTFPSLSLPASFFCNEISSCKIALGKVMASKVALPVFDST
jgi:hypothetical protein